MDLYCGYCGIDVYYSNKKGIKNIVFFPDGTYRYYDTGGMLFEMISDEAIYLTTEKVLNMIRAYPGVNNPLSRKALFGGLDWLYCAIDDDELPLATALFRSGFAEAVYAVSDTDGAETNYQTVGAFLEACYEEYVQYVKIFALFCDALASDVSGVADDFQTALAAAFKESVDDLFEMYTKKCSVRHRNGMASVETHNISNSLQLLAFEFCRLKKESKSVKICANCGRYFIPPYRNDMIYCPAPSPQDLSKSCNEIGPQAKRAEQRKRVPLEREHHNARSRLNMAVKRARDNGEEHLLSGYKRMLELEKAKYESEKTYSSK